MILKAWKGKRVAALTRNGEFELADENWKSWTKEEYACMELIFAWLSN